MKQYNYLFENDNGPFFVYCENNSDEAYATAVRLTDFDVGEKLFFLGKFTDDEADDMGYDTY